MLQPARTRTLAAFLVPALVALAACERIATETQPTTAAPEEMTLGAAVSTRPELAALVRALDAADFMEALDQGRPYTLLAPTDAAFAKLGADSAAFSTAQNKAALQNFVREHVIAGYVGLREIEAAIARNAEQPITMRTAGEGSVTFARGENGIVLTGSHGMTARIAGETLRARNGAAIPIDSVLAKLPD